jgi:hypothetical protein
MSAFGMVRFSYGPATAVVRHRRLALIDEPIDSAVTATIVNAFDSDQSLGQLMTTLSAFGFDALPTFAVIESDAGRLRIVHRGRVAVAVETIDGASVAFSQPLLSTWREEVVDSAATLSLVLEHAVDLPSFWFSGEGVVPAGRLAVEVASGEVVEQARVIEMVVVAPPASTAERSMAAEPVLSEPLPPHDSAPRPADDQVVQLTEHVDQDGERTVFRTPISEVPSLTIPQMVDTTIVVEARPARTVVDDPDHDGHTVARPRRLLTPSPVVRTATTAVTTGAPLLQAVSCPAGHLNPPSGRFCRLCRIEIVDRTPTRVERPALGRLVFSTGERVLLDGPILIGRNPPEGQLIDGESARPVTIDNSELSRLHVAIHLFEWFVYAEDQGSTNGTVVCVDGKPNETLRPFKKLELPPDAVVDLGSGVTFRFEVAE